MNYSKKPIRIVRYNYKKLFFNLISNVRIYFVVLIVGLLLIFISNQFKISVLKTYGYYTLYLSLIISLFTSKE